MLHAASYLLPPITPKTVKHPMLSLPLRSNSKCNTMYIHIAVKVDWDENKSRANIAKHGIEFSTAKSVFDDPLFVTRLDPFPDEERSRTVGAAPNGILFVVHTIKEL